jgi:nucleotide-binding universal stress UspA family protein
MYKKILAPMDGSPFSECTIEHVKGIAAGCNVPEVVLFRVVEPMSSNDLAALGQMSATSLEQVEAWKKSEATEYITGMVQRLTQEGVSARGEIVSGKAEDQILDYANNNHVDLIIMSTHGRSGIARWAFGSVADRVVRSSTVPVLTVAPPGCRTTHI